MSKISNYQFLMLLTVGFVSLAVFGGGAQKSFAASQAECSIWLCLPGGFAAGCAAAHVAMISRLKDFKPPLPAFASCSTGGSGNYKMGYEKYEPCKEGLTFIPPREKIKAVCRSEADICRRFRLGEVAYAPPSFDCKIYDAVRRPKPHFIETWVNENYLGKFFYQ